MPYHVRTVIRGKQPVGMRILRPRHWRLYEESIWEESPLLDIKVELHERRTANCAVRQGNSSNSSLFY